MTTKAQMEAITQEIASRDRRFATLIESYPLCTIGRTKKPSARTTNFESLVESVVSQQLAVKAADTIHARLVELAGGSINPASIRSLSETSLRSAGVSGAKSKTIFGLADAELNGVIHFEALHKKSDEEIFTSLTSLWGIGPWTVDMFMMFQLGRLNIWPTGDLGVRRGWEKIYKLSQEITPRELEQQGEKFSPYRSVVAWYCWRALTPPSK